MIAIICMKYKCNGCRYRKICDLFEKKNSNDEECANENCNCNNSQSCEKAGG